MTGKQGCTAAPSTASLAPRTRRIAPGVLLALLLLALRLFLPAGIMPGPAGAAGARDSGLATLLGDIPICHSSDGESPQPADAPAPAHDCALCPVCELAAAPALRPAAAWTVAAAPAGSVRAAPVPPATGPPRAARAAARPRAPPLSAA